MAEQSITTLGDFLKAGQTDYQVFDIGRRLTEISQEQFDAIEHQQQPYPYPIARQAQIAVLFQHKSAEQPPYLWFLQFPLDERGLLNLAARNQYLEYVINALGHEITGELTEEQQQQLQQNPYLLTPSETQRAALHAHVQCQHNLSPSIHFETAEAYLLNPNDSLDWQNIGLQGLHDVAARLMQHNDISTAIAEHFASYPGGVRSPLAAALEHQSIPAHLRNALLELINTDDSELTTDALRALASTSDEPRVQKQIASLIENANTDQLVVIAARLWPVLAEPTTLNSYLNAIAKLDMTLFDTLFQDIIALPTVRPQLLSLIAQQQLSEPVQQALNRLKSQVQ
ncbi:hypothetical protein CEW91_07595 [Idiomarina piscisalsi]|uniref:DUF3549 domain-containing protein n=1 Tax=Idiomarina piscisalsi TaxID=1096243 RepID=A0ABN5AQG0_9GAMM|nr:DUF3549 family protein [Idiomarina piscisalsi]ASG66015.1 hypothetical protein CEW91_07595 [Idiomarina piscisalsi]